MEKYEIIHFILTHFSLYLPAVKKYRIFSVHIVQVKI